jgi:hypothetical protein
VHSQKDTEDADIALERTELRTNERGEHRSWRQCTSAAVSIPRSRRGSPTNS